MKRIVTIAACALALAFFAGCRPGAQRDAGGDFPPDLIVLDPSRLQPADEEARPNYQPGDEAPQPEPVARSRRFELPIGGSTGYAGVNMPLLEASREGAGILALLDAGQGFTILREDGEWWHVDIMGINGWVQSRACLINLPDIIPSIVYNITNTYFSLFRSSWLDIPNVTGEALYSARDFNSRLGRYEFIVPVLYGMAERIFTAQQAALADGNTLVIYEAFRPHDAHQIVYDNFNDLIQTDATVLAGVTSDWFTINWFLAPAPYTHQMGTAIDVSLAAIRVTEVTRTGDFAFVRVVDYVEFPMPTIIHELSGAAALFAHPVFSRDDIAWRTAAFAKSATDGVRLLMEYATGAGLTPLASEWWHFNDWESTRAAIDLGVIGHFSTERNFSRPPIVYW
ncbi:MAG: hypothetical protein FWE09_03630 [Treponema sp.]|nr:hypothetical protein [Treponema sp.]